MHQIFFRSKRVLTLSYSFVLFFVYLICCSHWGWASSVPFDDIPTVWRKVDGEVYSVHQQLKEKLQKIPPAHPHNRALAQMRIYNDQGGFIEQDFPVPPLEVYKSNHVYVDMSEFSKERIEGELKRVRQEFKEKATQINSAGTNTVDEIDTLDAACDTEIQMINMLKQKSRSVRQLRTIEGSYLEKYPFKDHKNRMLDSEVSLCRAIDKYLSCKEVYAGGRYLSIYIYSDFNPCFCCVQTIHYYAKLFAQRTSLPLVVYVSSNQEYVWKGTLPPPHNVPSRTDGSPSMREYGKDSKQDELLTTEEEKMYVYSDVTSFQGKIIQIFL